MSICEPLERGFRSVFKALPTQGFASLLPTEHKQKVSKAVLKPEMSFFLYCLDKLRITCHDAVAEVPPSVEKAEKYLRYYSLGGQATNESEQEALVYCRSRSKSVPQNTISTLVDAWHHMEDAALQQATQLMNPPFRKSRISPLRRKDIINTSCFVLSDFWSGTDNEQLVVDATMLRTTDWCKIKGFDSWWTRWAREAGKEFLHGGVEMFTMRSLYLFSILRSNMAINLLGGDLTHAVVSLMRGEVSQEEPWRQLFPSPPRSDIRTTSVPIAATVLFGANILGLTKSHSRVVSRALDFLVNAQDKRTGSWRWWSFDKHPSVPATAMALHALCLARPPQWEVMAAKSREWLFKQQKPFGYWWEDGALGSPTNITVLALDSIAMSKGSEILTFSLPKSLNCAIDPEYDYSKCDYYRPREPATTLKRCVDLSADEKHVDIVIVVATPTERLQVLRLLNPLDGHDAVLKVSRAYIKEDYFLGRFGKFSTVVVKCEMTRDEAQGATLVVNDACTFWKPKGVIMIGIAFAASRQCLPADILIAEDVFPYDDQRVSMNEISFRKDPLVVGGTFLARMKAFTSTFASGGFLRPDKSPVSVYVGTLLSGSKLFDNPKFKRGIIAMAKKQKNVDAVGGEMEGVGVVSAAARRFVECAIVKGTSDWGDGKKHKVYQEMAAAAATKFVYDFLSDADALKGLKHCPL